MKAKNEELRDVIESEKKTLSDKIEAKMASTLEMAVKDRMETQKKLSVTEEKLIATERDVHDLKNQNSKLNSEKMTAL